MNAQGTGQGAIVDTSGRLVDSSNPATPGTTFVSIYCTGLGAVTNQPPTGAVTPNSPLSRTLANLTVTIGGVSTPGLFSGLAPGAVGEYQVNVQVPLGAQMSNAAQVVISIGGVSSNVVTMAVGPPQISATPTLTSIAPNNGTAGRVLTVLITGANTNFVQSQTLATFGTGTSVGGSALGQAGLITVTSPTTATAQVTLDASATAGGRTVVVTTGGQTASLTNGFTVQAPPAPLGPLAITSALPPNGATAVSMTPSIQITFNEPLDPTTVGPSTFQLANSLSTVSAAISIDSTGMIVTITPLGVLSPGATYSVIVGTQVRNAAENLFGTVSRFSFTTVAPTTVSGSLSLPAGHNPTTLSVVSFGGTVSSPTSSGGFSASVNPMGTSFVAAMLPNESFGFLAVALDGTSATSTGAVAEVEGLSSAKQSGPSDQR